MKIKIPLCAFVVILPLISFAQGVLDQSFEPVEPNVFFDNFSGNSIGQTFTVGIAGSLTEVDAYIARPITPIVSWQLTRVSDGTLLASGDLVNSTAPFGYSFEACLIPAGIVPVTPGDILAITLSSSGFFQWAGNNGNPYSGGAEISDPLSDVGFRSYVTPIPEPTSLALISVATACALCRRRHAQS
jgi:hypothetical protein